MSSTQQNNSKLRHLMASSSFINMELSHHITDHTHGPSCSHECGHEDNELTENHQDTDIGE